MSDPRYRTAAWRKLRQQAIHRYGAQCATPGCHADLTQPGALFVDHRHEIKDGGAFWDLNNLQILCKPHHDAKTATTRAQRLTQPASPNA